MTVLVALLCLVENDEHLVAVTQNIRVKRRIDMISRGVEKLLLRDVRSPWVQAQALSIVLEVTYRVPA